MRREIAEASVDASALWAAVDLMHGDVEADSAWASDLGVEPDVQAKIVRRLNERSAQWIGDHMDVLVVVDPGA